MGSKCRKCGKPTNDCHICKGSGRKYGGPCTECNATGKVCNNGHGKHWK